MPGAGMVPRRACVRSCYRVAVVTLDEQELWHGKPSLKVLALDALWVAGFTLALAAYVILNLEFPRLGFVRFDNLDELLVEARASMN